jgi:hypothetical protein
MWQALSMNNDAAAAETLLSLSADDVADLEYVGSLTGSDWRTLPRAGELDDYGAKLIGLGLLEVRVEPKYGLAGSARLGVTDAGLDALYEIERSRKATAT